MVQNHFNLRYETNDISKRKFVSFFIILKPKPKEFNYSVRFFYADIEVSHDVFKTLMVISCVMYV